MANPEIESLVRDARDLMIHVKSQDQNLEEVIRRASAIRAKIECMKEYQEVVDLFNTATSNGKTRSILLKDLHKETRLIQKYVKENLELKEINNELLTGLNNIMNRHRSLMEQMARPENKMGRNVLPQLFEINQAVKERKYQLHERNMFYYRKLTNCLNKCEQGTIENAEIMASLREENAGLRELLNMHKMNEPDVIRVYNRIRLAFEEKRSQEKDEMQQTIREWNYEDDNSKKNSIIENKKTEEEEVSILEKAKEEDENDANTTILRAPNQNDSL